MNQEERMNEALCETYCRDYMDKVFYFCLRKTGSEVEAEDLASDVTLQILTALRQGMSPEHFAGWVWQIARNRYALWAKKRHRRLAYEADTCVDELEAAGTLGTVSSSSVTPGVNEDYIRDETLAALRRELAFLRRDWREVVVAYYIEDRSVKDIAAAIGETENTVK